jgi:hypothetical protein
MGERSLGASEVGEGAEDGPQSDVPKRGQFVESRTDSRIWSLFGVMLLDSRPFIDAAGGIGAAAGLA